MKRCFVAMGLPATTREAVARAQASLLRVPRHAARKIRPIRPANLHVTLKFLGHTPDEQISEIIEALAAVAATVPPLAAILEGVGAFPSPIRPRVIFAALGRGSQEVATLVDTVQAAAAQLGFPAERRPSVAHVTLARIETARHDGPLTQWIDDAAGQHFGPVAGDTLILYESQLGPGGAVYTPLASLALGS